MDFISAKYAILFHPCLVGKAKVTIQYYWGNSHFSLHSLFSQLFSLSQQIQHKIDLSPSDPVSGLMYLSCLYQKTRVDNIFVQRDIFDKSQFIPSTSHTLFSHLNHSIPSNSSFPFPPLYISKSQPQIFDITNTRMEFSTHGLSPNIQIFTAQKPSYLVTAVVTVTTNNFQSIQFQNQVSFPHSCQIFSLSVPKLWSSYRKWWISTLNRKYIDEPGGFSYPKPDLNSFKIGLYSIHPSGMSYTLAPVYGFDFKAAVEDEDDDVNTCIICLCEPSSIIILPCGHLNICDACFQRISECPTCRKEISGHVIVHFHTENNNSH